MLTNYLPGIFGPSYQYQTRLRIASRVAHELPVRELYQLLKAMYLSNGLYDALQQMLYESSIWSPSMRPLRNCTYPVVEFHASKLLVGQLDIDSENAKRLTPAIEQIWKWSNWDAQKIVYTRQLAIYGDAFIKVVSKGVGTAARVYFQLIDPCYVSHFETDERGFVDYIRLDIPRDRSHSNTTEPTMHTEVWDATTQTYRLWLHSEPDDCELERLGPPDQSIPLSDFGIDFVPFVRAPFRDIGERRGIAAVLPAIDDIMETDMMATRLHQQLFRYNKHTMAVLAGGVDKDGRPMPAPRVEGRDGGNANGAYTADGRRTNGTVVTGDDDIMYLPGNSKLQFLVPPINFGAHLDALNAQVAAVERKLPEMAYYRLPEMGALSGRAVKLILSDAIDRAREARANAEQALVRADMMALTMAQNASLVGDLGGTFDSGALDHSFKERPIIPTDDLEDAQAELAKGQALKAWTDAGLPLTEALRRVGYNDEAIVTILDEKSSEVAANPAPQPPTDVIPPVGQ